MRAWLKKTGYISVKTYLVILGCIVLPMFCSFRLIQRQYETYLQNQLSEQILSSISKSEEAVYDSFRNIAGISSSVVTNNALVESLESEGASYYAINKRFDDCVNYSRINNLYASYDLLLTMFDRKGRCYANWEQGFHDYGFLLEEEWVQEARQSKGHLVWNLFSPSFIRGRQEQLLSAARAIYNPASVEEACGLLIVSMPQSSLSRVLSGFCYAPDDSVYVLGDGEVPILKYAPLEDGEAYRQAVSLIQGKERGNLRLQTAGGVKLVSYYTLQAPRTLGEQALRIMHVTDFQPVLSQMAQFSRRMNLIVAATLLCAVLIAGGIVRWLVQPVRRLSTVMREYQLGSPLEGLDMERKDEVGQLNRSFRGLTQNIQELFGDLEAEYRARERYRYESLRAQLNPHFLFNALNTIRYMAIMQHAAGITEGIDALAAVLKYSMGREDEKSCLQDELSHVEGYIAIQNMRFGKRIELEEDFEPEVLALYTPRFILQPLVENAVIHGFGESLADGSRCLIRLYGHVEEGKLHLFVEDNGSGISSELVDTLNQGKRSKLTGIGFSHVRELIRMNFGPEYNLELHSEPGKGTVVHYILPVIHPAKEGEAHEESPDRG